MREKETATDLVMEDSTMVIRYVNFGILGALISADFPFVLILDLFLFTLKKSCAALWPK